MSEPAEGVSAPADGKHLKLDAIASIGSAVALLIFTLISPRLLVETSPHRRGQACPNCA
jgi:hypothetical protein